MFSDFVQRSPRPSECINTVVLTCCTYWWHSVLTWLTEQCTGEDAPAREVQTHIFLSWSRNIYFTFILLGSHGFKFHGLSSHTAKVEQTCKCCFVFSIIPKMVSDLYPLPKPDFMLLRENDMKVTIKNPDKLVTVEFKSLKRFYLMMGKWII